MEQEDAARNGEPRSEKASRWGFRGMTVRNWLELLVVPLVLVGIGLALDLRQQGLENQRAERERELAEQRAARLAPPVPRTCIFCRL